MEPVYITGMCAITPIGSGNHALWKAVEEGRSGLSVISRFDTSWLSNNIAACVTEENPLHNLNPEEMGALRPATRYMISAAREALKEAEMLDENFKVKDTNCALFLSTTHSEIQSHLDKYLSFIKNHNGDYISQSAKNLFVDHITYQLLIDTARTLDLRGMQSMNTNACASSGYAITLGIEHLRQGRGKVALCGGVDITSVAEYAGFCSVRSLAPECCQPFDRDRKGLVIGEGSGAVILETAKSVKERGVKPIARILGYGWSNDAYHLSAPHPESVGVIQSVVNALKDAKIKIPEVDYIMAHGTGTVSNDKNEAMAFYKVFEKTPPLVTSVKSMIGHTMGAASVIEIIIAALSMQKKIIPPTINYNNPDPDCPVNVVANEPQAKEISVCLTNSSGFGGNNDSLVLSVPDYQGVEHDR